MAAFGPPQLAGQANQPNSFKPARLAAPRPTITQLAIQGHSSWGYPAAQHPTRPITGGTGATAPPPGNVLPSHLGPLPDAGSRVMQPGQGIAAVGAAQPSGLDSTYYQQLANATLAANNRINSYNQQSGYAGTDLQNALSQLNYQQGLQTQNAQNAENSRGGFALGHLGQTIGQVNHAYLDRQSADQQTYARQQAARDAAVSAVRQGLSLEQAALAAAAADRSSQAAAKNPAIGQSSAPLTPPPTGGAPVGGTRPPQLSRPGSNQPNSHHSGGRRPGGRRPIIGGSGGNFTVGLGRPPRSGTVSGGG